ncbi:MAG: hypothetical protein AVDCRST_MAG08-1908 [uncultured Acetobacteraceae bacterium]|uniref:Polymerase nucleotidyl transferase domain-containing protein n=1 Tax=uncultured Acetobacteraceae bacterium TaxID=169975 RepID=A0A6J4IAJ1_9PROT|nr:MAG: hypothetical protein AVDCRST_MAG08-1908 [uncultured Acetobacteraceae bacterium]
MAAVPLPPVRLGPEEIAAVKPIVAEHFGPEAEVRVFGSRARLDQRGGGDLDLHVRLPGEKPGWPAEDRAADAIERALDDLHVDWLLLGSGDAPQRIDEVAMETGALLRTHRSCGIRWRPPSRTGLRLRESLADSASRGVHRHFSEAFRDLGQSTAGPSVAARCCFRERGPGAVVTPPRDGADGRAPRLGFGGCVPRHSQAPQTPLARLHPRPGPHRAAP